MTDTRKTWLCTTCVWSSELRPTIVYLITLSPLDHGYPIAVVQWTMSARVFSASSSASYDITEPVICCHTYAHFRFRFSPKHEFIIGRKPETVSVLSRKRKHAGKEKFHIFGTANEYEIWWVCSEDQPFYLCPCTRRSEGRNVVF